MPSRTNYHEQVIDCSELRELRGTNKFSIPRVPGLHCFRYFVPKTWNTVPENIKWTSVFRDVELLLSTLSFVNTSCKFC